MIYKQALLSRFSIIVLLCIGYIASSDLSYAATLRLSPDTGIYTAGSTFTASVVINTQGKPINASDAQLSFNPSELSVVSVGKSGSIFNLWTLEPTYSNAAGTISYGGGSPTGYTGQSGTIMTITFRTLGAGTPKVTFKSGSILAADGMGTNVLTAMNGGSYTIQAKTDTPPPEYVPPANTPGAPTVTSVTHPNESVWYREKNAKVSWNVPSGVTAVRTLLDTSRSSIPTKVYEEAITSRDLTDLPEGTSYFHIQLKNADGWGRVTHFALNVDSEEPDEFSIEEKDVEGTDPARTLLFLIKDTSPIIRYAIQIDGGEVIEYLDKEDTKTYTLPPLPPGHHTVVVEAFDSADNSRVATYAFDVRSFEAPVFTEYPERMSSGVIPVLRGTTRPLVEVEITVRQKNESLGTFVTKSDEAGQFVFVPDEAFEVGVYEITALARDGKGSQSEMSEPIRVIVEERGYIAVGSFLISALSIIIPLIGLIFLLIFGSWYFYHRFSVWRGLVRKETGEAEEKLRSEFSAIIADLHAHVAELKDSKKTKLTHAETELIESMEKNLREAQSKIRKEISDIQNIVQ